jgi:hypothetical protein
LFKKPLRLDDNRESLLHVDSARAHAATCAHVVISDMISEEQDQQNSRYYEEEGERLFIRPLRALKVISNIRNIFLV